MARNQWGFPIEKAIAQSRLRKECEKQGGHAWEAMKPIEVDGSVFDMRCQHCGLEANTAWEERRLELTSGVTERTEMKRIELEEKVWELVDATSVEQVLEALEEIARLKGMTTLLTILKEKKT